MKYLTISRIVLLVLFIGTSINIVFAQGTIGSVPAGTSIVYNIVHLRTMSHVRDTFTYLDLDGDGNQDIKIKLHDGAPPVDDPHIVIFEMLNNAFSFCTDVMYPYHTHLYEFGESFCDADQEWGSESLYIVGCNGGFNCGNLPFITDQYIAYKKITTDEVGWMKISATLRSGVSPDSISFSISELVVLYLGSGTHTISNPFEFSVFPNPTVDGQCYIACKEELSAIEVYSSTGKLIRAYAKGTLEFTLPDLPGLYLVKSRNEKGQYAISNMVRY